MIQSVYMYLLHGALLLADWYTQCIARVDEHADVDHKRFGCGSGQRSVRSSGIEAPALLLRLLHPSPSRTPFLRNLL